MWEGLYTAPMTFPPRPAYITSDGFDVGMAISEMVTSLYRAASKYATDIPMYVRTSCFC